jgi:hypothetical protein
MASAPHSPDHRSDDAGEAALWNGWLHEVRTALQVLLGRTQLLRRRVGAQDHVHRHAMHMTLQTIEDATHGLMR